MESAVVESKYVIRGQHVCNVRVVDIITVVIEDFEVRFAQIKGIRVLGLVVYRVIGNGDVFSGINRVLGSVSRDGNDRTYSHGLFHDIGRVVLLVRGQEF